jgi:hypothetical protein
VSLILPPGAADAARGGILLPLPGTSTKRLVRNGHGTPILCCYADCAELADDRVQINIPHPEARFKGERLIYTFCSNRCRRAKLAGTPWQDKA